MSVRRYKRICPRGIIANGQPSEAMEAKWLAEWALTIPSLSDTLFHISNEGKRRAYGSLLSTRLIRAGVSDYFLPLPCGGHHGMFLELKAIGARLTDDQVAWLERMLAHGYACEVAYGCEDAKRKILAYLDLKPPLGVL